VIKLESSSIVDWLQFGARFENQLGEIIEPLLPMLEIVAVFIDVPDVRKVLVLQTARGNRPRQT